MSRPPVPDIGTPKDLSQTIPNPRSLSAPLSPTCPCALALGASSSPQLASREAGPTTLTAGGALPAIPGIPLLRGLPASLGNADCVTLAA